MSAHLKAKLIFIAVLCAGGLGTDILVASEPSLTTDLSNRDPQAEISRLIADSPVELHGVEIGKVAKDRTD